MDWRISNGAVRCTALDCGDHMIPAGQPYVRVRCGTNRCDVWARPQREYLDADIAKTRQQLAAAVGDEERAALEASLEDLQRQRATLDPPTDLRVPVPVPQPSLPMELTRGKDMVGAKQVARSARFNRFRERQAE